MELRVRSVGPWPMNTYALICPHSGQSVLIDPGAEPHALEELLAGSRPHAILVTHSHPDHIGALEEMRRRLKVPILAHPRSSGIAIDRPLQNGERLALGAQQLIAIHTPGHTVDQICLGIAGDPRKIVGDTIFDGGPGRTWSAADFKTTLQTLKQIVLAWPDETVCYPGHGAAFRLGDIRQAVERFATKDHGDFFGDATWAM